MNTNQPKFIRDFDARRGEEYGDLLHLVNVAGSLDKGSGIIRKIKTLEDIAERLNRCDVTQPRQSFLQWLEGVAQYCNSENDKQ